jgi:flagellar protein FliT
MNDRHSMEQQIVDRYVRMAHASNRMLLAAREDDWDQVCQVERECTAIIAELSAMGDLSPTDPELRQRKLGLMKRVLADDAEIRLLSQPWLRKLESILGAPTMTARLDRAYGARGA